MTKHETDCACGSGAVSTRSPFDSDSRSKTAMQTMLAAPRRERTEADAAPGGAPGVGRRSGELGERAEEPVDLVGGVRVNHADADGAVREAEVSHHLDCVVVALPDSEAALAQLLRGGCGRQPP